MKTHLLLFSLLIACCASAQITTPVIRAGFGVDGDMRANFYNGFVQSGNDDWYGAGILGTGQFVIDTTGAVLVRNGYATDVSPYPKRMASFFRTMSRPSFSVVNNRLWLDALFVRDYHGNDTTVFTSGSDKNGMSPANWSGGVQGIPDKNDILDMFMHVRRAGPNRTDSLWFFGALSLDNVTGNRYFDFELYQTDIYYDRISAKWYGYGPDAGHTSWKFDAAGNVLTPGDIIFSAEYQSASLTNIEARIWVNKNDMSINPTAFNWSGQFDGDGTGAQFGYASILPKTGGAFYTGLQCGNSEWAGPFSLVLQSNTVVTNYTARQLMEFSVNLTKLGLDPATVFGTDICGTPFNRVVVKTRASASFTSELKDFVAPIDLFLAPRVDALADVPLFCGTIGVSNLTVQNPSASSVYTWSTPDGSIFGSTTGTSITVNRPGTYIVRQQLAAACGTYATDTVVVTYDATCTPLESRLLYFKGNILSGNTQLQWALDGNTAIQFDVERSRDGRNFETLQSLYAGASLRSSPAYNWTDTDPGTSGFVYYRLRVRLSSGKVLYSSVIVLSLASEIHDAIVFPNPASSRVQIQMPASQKGFAQVTVTNAAGSRVHQSRVAIKKDEPLAIDVSAWQSGVYFLQIETDRETYRQKLTVNRSGAQAQ
jgi:hypothetical protein